MVDKNDVNNGIPLPKIEKVSLKTIQTEKKKEKDEEYEKAFKEFVDSYKSLSIDEKKMFFEAELKHKK